MISMKNYLGQKKALEDKIETTFRRLTDAELRHDVNEVQRQRANYEFYRAELEALNLLNKKPINTGSL